MRPQQVGRCEVIVGLKAFQDGRAGIMPLVGSYGKQISRFGHHAVILWPKAFLLRLPALPAMTCLRPGKTDLWLPWASGWG